MYVWEIKSATKKKKKIVTKDRNLLILVSAIYTPCYCAWLSSSDLYKAQSGASSLRLSNSTLIYPFPFSFHLPLSIVILEFGTSTIEFTLIPYLSRPEPK